MQRALALLLCGYLLAWVPLTFATEVFATFPSLQMRGVPAIAELLVHAVIALIAATGGWMVWTRAPGASTAAAAAVVASTAGALQSLCWTALPRNIAPGERLPFALLLILHAVFWLVFIGARRRGVNRRPH